MTRDLNDRIRDNDLPENIRDACAPINELAKRWERENPTVRTVQQLLQGSLRRAFAKEKPKALRTGNWSVDSLTGGIRPGHVWVVGADTSWGKSSWIVSVADENMSDGARVLIVSSEDREELYADRLMCRRAEVNATRLRDRHLDDGEMRRVAQVVNDALPVPAFLDARGATVESIVEKLSVIIPKHRIDLVCIDYLQEIKTDKRSQDRRNEVADIASQLRTVIKGHRIAGIIASQITVVDGKKVPDKHSIRETRDVSNAAEVVILGYFAESDFNKSDGETVPAGSRIVNIDKSKDGEKGHVVLAWNTESACFIRQLKPDRTIPGRYDIPGFQADNDPPDYNPPHPATPDHDDDEAIFGDSKEW
jgi:replicative DNA helicase